MRCGSTRWIVGIVTLLIAGWLLLRPSGAPAYVERGPLEADRSDAELAEELSRIDASLRQSTDVPTVRLSGLGTSLSVKLLRRARLVAATAERAKSRTLAEAVAAYRTRYRRAPPRGFDDWYALASAIGGNVDAYDSIDRSLEPFWALEPADIRARQEALPSTAPGLGRVSIRHGRPILYSRQNEHLRGDNSAARKSFEAMLKEARRGPANSL